ncbi:hypothetical protein AMECASPLE_007858 [Ameca splendens]|uniref:Uncharacterized protein n=1 Tax=Ameca splendens TaxID=208324 RepID=A0ABV0Z8M1_9TELE
MERSHRQKEKHFSETGCTCWVNQMSSCCHDEESVEHESEEEEVKKNVTYQNGFLRRYLKAALGSRKANKAVTDVWMTLPHFFSWLSCNDFGGQRRAPELLFSGNNQTEDMPTYTLKNKTQTPLKKKMKEQFARTLLGVVKLEQPLSYSFVCLRKTCTILYDYKLNYTG